MTEVTLLRNFKTQRDGMGREEGGGFRMGNTCMPVADSFLYMAEPINIVNFKNKIKLKKRNNFTEISLIYTNCRI